MPTSSSRYLRTAFIVGLFVILCIGGFTYKHISELSQTSKVVNDNYSLRSELEIIISNLKDAEIGHRGFLLTHDSLFLNPYEESLQKVTNNLHKLDTLIVSNGEQVEKLKVLKSDIEKRFNNFDRSFSLANDDTILTQDLLFLLHEGEIRMDRIRADITEMLDLEQRLLIHNQEVNEKKIGLTPLFFYGLLIVTLVILLLAYFKMSKDLKALKDNNIELEIFEKLTKQSEIVSNTSTWVWYIEENEFEFSDNLYRLVGEEPQSFEPTLENFYEYVHEEDINNLGQQVNMMMREEELPFTNFRVVHKDGTIRHLKAYSKMMDETEGDKKMFGVTIDATNEVENYRIIEQRNQELERTNKELSAFNYVASHDLQEPLRKIQTFMSRLETKEKDHISESGQLYIQRMKSASARMRMLIEDLLQYSRTNTSEKEYLKTNMNMLLEHAKTELLDSIEEKQATIICDDLPTMDVISFQIQQLFINLISNSLKYSKEGVPPIIEITHQEVFSKDVEEIKESLYKFHHKITFKDNGIGFEQTYAEKIFLLFNRLHGKSEYSGTGIGLAICKKIVENHKGVIMAEARPNVGASFIIYLPFLK
ncbi:putative two-component sensor histidine kinase [Winogradskyella psychrotolerans RS-3]|uniref:histidine kinase n=1 Tax=Winogradskyella psychrotolerans RS-3 TaxID=641526 RepID=S7VRB5_9FLAO|nr:CHASE3 domain-containing protein [Winogradskyella psychrotolerans]EPR72551.1 putative two-component sensor histidine kinase [Winogradskyella psychrotolerans RS-3]